MLIVLSRLLGGGRGEGEEERRRREGNSRKRKRERHRINSGNGIFWQKQIAIHLFNYIYFKSDKATDADSKAKIWDI